jgi:hypothetical protein
MLFARNNFNIEPSVRFRVASWWEIVTALQQGLGSGMMILCGSQRLVEKRTLFEDLLPTHTDAHNNYVDLPEAI